jgi:hypothetical protein
MPPFWGVPKSGWNCFGSSKAEGVLTWRTSSKWNNIRQLSGFGDKAGHIGG